MKVLLLNDKLLIPNRDEHVIHMIKRVQVSNNLNKFRHHADRHCKTTGKHNDLKNDD